MSKALVAGVGMVKFAMPGQHRPFRVMAAEAIRAGLSNANLEISAVQQAYAGYVYGDSTSGQHVLYDVGQTGIPIINVNNNCSSGSTALFLARQAIESGMADCALAFGFEEMRRGAIEAVWSDREDPLQKHNAVLDDLEYPAGPVALRVFGAAAAYYLEEYGGEPSLFAKVAVKSRNHAKNNPFAVLHRPLTVEEVLNDRVIYGSFLTRTMACPPTCGAAAAVLCSDKFAREHGIAADVAIVGQAMVTDTPESWVDPIRLVGSEVSRRCANQAYAVAGLGPDDVDVIELHDCFTPNEVFSYEALGLCAEGEAAKLVSDGDNTFEGKWVINPSGGLMSKGHPLGATGLAQCAEIVWQLRGEAGARQVANAKVGLQHNVGLGGAGVVTIYQAL